LILEEILKDLEKTIDQKLKGQIPPVERVIVGIGFTGVLLQGEYLGLAFTILRDAIKKGCTKTKIPGRYWKKTPFELASYALDNDLLHRAIGMAAINAISDYIFKNTELYHKEYNIFKDVIQKPRSIKIYFIGNIMPIAIELERMGFHIELYDNNPYALNIHPVPKNRSLTFHKSPQDLDLYDINVITGSSIVNHTIDGILEKTRKDQEIYIIGPSSNCIPGPFFKHGVKAIGGVEITNVKKTLSIIEEGGGTKIFKKFGKLYLFINKEWKKN